MRSSGVWPAAISLLAVSTTWGVALLAAQHGGSMGTGHYGAARTDGANGCAEPTLRCATVVMPSVGPDGTLWIAWTAAGRVFVSRSGDFGRTFAQPIPITAAPVTLDAGADARPQMVVDRKGRIVVSYVVMRGDKYVGQVMVSHSADGGATFSPPRPISEGVASQRFISLVLDDTDAIFATWVDKSRLLDAERAGTPFAGASLAIAWSNDGGQTFGPARMVHDHTCECCRLAVASKGPRQPAVLFRNIFGGERDHAVLTLGPQDAVGRVARVSEDHWRIDACPHHGPSLAIDSDGVYHVTWFSGGGQRRGVFYARSTDGGQTFSTPMPVGAPGRQPGRPYLLANSNRLWLAWKEFDGERSTIHAMSSRDGGRTWSDPRTVAATGNYSDHPLLIARGGQAFLSWMTRADGYRVIALETKS